MAVVEPNATGKSLQASHPETAKTPSDATKRKRRPSRLLPLLLALALGVPGGFLSARIIHIPLVDTLDTYRPSVISRLYDRSGHVFAEYSIQRRIIVPNREIGKYLHDGIISTEDARFYQHGGIDPRAIVRAGIKDLMAGRKIEGASTLTQQLAKQLFLTTEKRWRRKINEAFLAVEIEKNFTKEQIFELYANQVYLGHGAYGVESASRLYFGKHAKDLTLPEAAVLAGMIRRPMYYSPMLNPDAARSRRNHVLRRMHETGAIGPDEYEKARNAPIVLGSYKEERPEVGSYFSEHVRQHVSRNYGSEDLYRKGLEVFTTLDVRMQQLAEKVLQRGLRRWEKYHRGFRKPARNLVAEGIDIETYVDPAWTDTVVDGDLIPAVVKTVESKRIIVRAANQELELPQTAWKWTGKEDLRGLLKRGDLTWVRSDLDSKTQERRWYLDQVPLVQGAIVVLDVKTGEVRAMVGGYDFNTSKFNRAVQSLRQTGSSFKPLVYGAAFEKGFTPGDTLFDSPIQIRLGPNDVYAPRNYYGQYSGIVTIQRAMELSINIPAVKTYMMIGGDSVVDFARRTGITAPLPQYPSLSLGAAGVSPLEMTASYNVFANQGVYVKPRFIRKVTDATQKVLEENYPELSEATTAQVAYLLTHTLQGTIDRGTGFEAHTLPGALAGKTGTTNGFTDAWFIGYSPELAVGVWVGYDDPRKTLGGGATGADVALPIWIDFFKAIDAEKLRGTPKETFDVPPGIVIVPMELKTGRRGIGPCSRVIQEAFIAGTEPDKDCSGSAVEVSKLPYYLQRPFYQPKEMEPVQAAIDATAKPGEGGESPAPPTDQP